MKVCEGCGRKSLTTRNRGGIMLCDRCKGFPMSDMEYVDIMTRGSVHKGHFADRRTPGGTFTFPESVTPAQAVELVTGSCGD